MKKKEKKCECRGHKEPISINDCICSPDDAEDLRTCQRIEEMRKKEKSMFDEPCRVCGVKFGADERSFTFEWGKKPICFHCQIDRTPKKVLKEVVKFLSLK